MLYYSIILLWLSSCGGTKEKKVTAPSNASTFTVPFDLNQPSKEMVLDYRLSEISGLSYSSMSENLLAVDDEQGKVFILDNDSGKIIDEIEFGKSDDYEGVASHDGYIYVVESNGNVKVLKEKTKKKIIEFNDRLSKENDVEGLCYDPHTQTILLAAKGNSETEGNTKHVKSIFTMNIDNGAIRKEPYLQVNMKASYMEMRNEDSGVLNKLTKSSRFRKYGPSGIAVDPISNFIYLLSSNSKSLSVLDHEGNIKSIILLDKKLHAQPEGITFDKTGNLFISNEGKKGSAMLYQYARIN